MMNIEQQATTYPRGKWLKNGIASTICLSSSKIRQLFFQIEERILLLQSLRFFKMRTQKFFVRLRMGLKGLCRRAMASFSISSDSLREASSTQCSMNFSSTYRVPW